MPVSRRPGRPKGQDSRRERILDAAASAIASHRSAAVNLRQVSRKAGVTPALLNYYFGNAHGLLEALGERIEAQMEPLRDELRSRPAGPAIALSRFLQKWSALLSRQPWLLPCLLSQAKLPNASLTGELRDAIGAAQREGALRGDLPCEYLAMLLLALGALPGLHAMGLGAGLDPEDQDMQPARLTLLHLSVLRHGVATPNL